MPYTHTMTGCETVLMWSSVHPEEQYIGWSQRFVHWQSSSSCMGVWATLLSLLFFPGSLVLLLITDSVIIGCDDRPVMVP